MSLQEEQYVHFVSSIDNLNTAWRILKKIIEGDKDNPLVGPAFRFAFIKYSKPYTCSRGTIKKEHKLDDKHIPDKHRELHKRILNARDKILAHSDLTVMEAKVYIADTEHGRFVQTSQNIIHGMEEFPNIDAIIDLIEQTLDSMYIEVKRLEAELSPNS